MNYTCVLFDLDQTLLLRDPSVPKKLYQVLRECDIACDIEQVEKAFAECEFWIGEQVQQENQSGVRMSDEEFLSKIEVLYQKALGLSESHLAVVRDIISYHYSWTYVLAPEAFTVLSKLKAKGLKLGIVSNNYITIHKTLSELGIKHFFDCIIISEEVGLQKPDPAIIQLACRECGVEPKRSIYVGDHPFDITCAHGAGVDAAWLPPNKWYRLQQKSQQPEMVLDRLSNLLTMIE